MAWRRLSCAWLHMLPLLAMLLAQGRGGRGQGVERAAWFEFDAADLPAGVSLQASLSEFNVPYPNKLRTPKQYGATFRLETNPELYEGLRFSWLYVHCAAPPLRPWRITAVRAVAQSKPVNSWPSIALWYASDSPSIVLCCCCCRLPKDPLC